MKMWNCCPRLNVALHTAWMLCVMLTSLSAEVTALVGNKEGGEILPESASAIWLTKEQVMCESWIGLEVAVPIQDWLEMKDVLWGLQINSSKDLISVALPRRSRELFSFSKPREEYAYLYLTLIKRGDAILLATGNETIVLMRYAEWSAVVEAFTVYYRILNNLDAVNGPVHYQDIRDTGRSSADISCGIKPLKSKSPENVSERADCESSDLEKRYKSLGIVGLLATPELGDRSEIGNPWAIRR